MPHRSDRPARIRTATPALIGGLALALATAVRAEVFINELHYDDAGAAGDTDEAIEVVASDGRSLAGYHLVLYNGSHPAAAGSYRSDRLPAGRELACGGRVRIASIRYPRNMLQNGPGDGIALVDATGRVVQFLSYEGRITAVDGPAAGMTSTPLPVAESNATAAGTSLQLGGHGQRYDHFHWQASTAQTFDACNAGQRFVDDDESGGDPPTIVDMAPADGVDDFPADGRLRVVFDQTMHLVEGALRLECSASGAVALRHPARGQAISAQIATTLAAGERCTFTITADKLSNNAGQHPDHGRTVSFGVAAAGNPGDFDPDAYYASVDTSSPARLRCSLHQIIKGHTVYPYSGGQTNTWTILEIADADPHDSGQILDAYRNRRYVKGRDRAGSGGGLKYNREHSWPNSLGFGNATGDKGLPNAPYTDAHMLYLTDAAWNAARGNKPYADCSQASGCGERGTEFNHGHGGGSGIYPGHSNWVRAPDGQRGSFQVWDRRKGDMARAVMYMAVRYRGGRDAASGQSEPMLELTDDRDKIVKTSSSPAYMGLLSTLLQWHRQDPPDAAERARHAIVFGFQGNRNPFIDHPEWASHALFTAPGPNIAKHCLEPTMAATDRANEMPLQACKPALTMPACN